MNIKDHIKRVLGITALENQIKDIELENDKIKKELILIRNRTAEIIEDNKLIIRHVKLINSDFTVVSDINLSKYEPTVVFVFRKRGEQETVKTYTFSHNLIDEIHRFLEGFGEYNNRIDQPRGFPRPRFRY